MRGHCACDATGLSSHAIATAFGHCDAGGIDFPWDPSDLSRCITYCNENAITPEQLRETMTPVSATWAILAGNWETLVDLLEKERAEGTGMAPQTYVRMRRLRGMVP